MSPSEVGHAVFEAQVKEAELCMQLCRDMIDNFEDILEGSPPDMQGRIRETLEELAAKVKESARVQNIAECRLEVAASLYLIFKLIIPVR